MYSCVSCNEKRQQRAGATCGVPRRDDGESSSTPRKIFEFSAYYPPYDTSQSPSSLKGQGSNDPTTQFTFFELFFWFSTEKKL